MNSPISNRNKMIIVLLGVFTASAATNGSYHLANTYKFAAAPGGREYFDYITVDTAARRVYMSHGTEVLVVNADSGALEDKISGLKLSHGVAVVPELDRGFITDGEQGKIVMFDLKTLKVMGDATAAPDATIPRPSISFPSMATVTTRRSWIRRPGRLLGRLISAADPNLPSRMAAE
jgi:hypothetical protein